MLGRHGIATIAATFAAVLLTACGGGGSGGDSGGGVSSGTASPPDASPGGIWEGTSSASGTDIIGLVTEAGEFHFISADGVQYFGSLTVDGTDVSASFTGVTQLGTAFADGTTGGNGTLNGTVRERDNLTGTTDFTTIGGSRTTGKLSLTYNTLYERDSSLATIAGDFSDGNGSVININSSGEIFMQDPITGCVVNGTVSIIDARYNAYRTEYTYSSCTGVDAVLNGLTFRGLGTLDNTGPTEQIIAGVTAGSGNDRISIVWVLGRI